MTLISELAPASQVAFTEGPAAAATGEVYFTDIVNNRIVCRPRDGGLFTVFRANSGRANGLLFDAQGRLLACEGNEFGPGGRRRITRTDMHTLAVEVLTDRYEGARYNAPNDIAASSNGRLYFTDPCYGDRTTMQMTDEAVYRIDPEGTVTRLITQPTIQRPNGIALSPDERTLYVVDSCPVIGGHRKIWAFDLSDNGEVSRQRQVYDFGDGRGGDGMAVDQEGQLYIAAGIQRPRGPHESTAVPTGIHILSPDGQPRDFLPIPEDVITNCTFGGDDLRTLYITAGKTLFQARTHVPGWVVHRRP